MALAVPLKAAAIAIGLNYGTYVTASYALTTFCVPSSIWDIPASLLTAASPACSFLVSVIQTTQNNYAVAFVSTLTTVAMGALKP
jgi:hypothetical protein